MSKATLWDVFESAMGTAQLITGDIAKYKIEQDEAEIRRFEIEQKKKMADFELELQADSQFDKYNEKYNTFMDEQQKDLMSRIKTNYGQQKATEWFDAVRTNGQIQVDQIETKLRKNHILATDMDTMNQNKEIYQGQELYDKNKEILDNWYQNQLVDTFQYHEYMKQLGNTVLEQRMYNIVDEAASNCQDLDQMHNYIDTNLNFNDLKMTKYSASGEGSEVDNTGVLNMSGYKEKAKDLATGIWNTKVKQIQDSNANYIREEIAGMLGEIESNPQGVLTKIGQCFQYMNNNPGNKFNAKERQSLANDLDDLRKRLQKGDTKGAGTAVASMTLKKDLKANDISKFIAHYQAGLASGYDIRSLVVENMFRDAQQFGYKGSKKDFVNENLSLNHQILDILSDNMPEQAILLGTQAESMCKTPEFKEIEKTDPTLAATLKGDLANFAVDLALNTKWDSNVDMTQLTGHLKNRYNAILLKTSSAYANAIKNEKEHAKALLETTGTLGEDIVYTNKYGVQVWVPGAKQNIEQEGGIRQTGQNLIAEIAGVNLEQVQPSYKVTQGGNDVSSEIQYKVGSDTYELRPSENGKKVDVYKNGKNLGNAYNYNINKVEQQSEAITDAQNAKLDEWIRLDFPSDLKKESLKGITVHDWRQMDPLIKIEFIESLKTSNPYYYDMYAQKNKKNYKSVYGKR